MQREILFALSGYPGDLFKSSPAGLSVVDVDFLSVAEKELANRIVRVGHHYQMLSSFVTRHGGGGNSGLPGLASLEYEYADTGLYVRALCTGMGQILDVYRAVLVEAEQKVMGDPTWPLSNLLHSLRDFTTGFPHLVTVVEAIEGQELAGGQILEVLYRASVCGVPAAKGFLDTILFHCHKIFFNHITAWAAHGLLLDRYGEFFIHERERVVGGSSGNDSGGSGGGGGSGGVAGSSGQQVALQSIVPMLGAERLESAELFDPVEAEHEWNGRYALRLDMLPSSYVPHRVADKILLLGKMMQLLDRAASLQQPDWTDRAGAASVASAASAGGASGSIEHRSGEATTEGAEKEAEFSVAWLDTARDSFLDAVASCRSSTHFRLLPLEVALDRLHHVVARHVWHLVVVDAELPKHLEVHTKKRRTRNATPTMLCPPHCPRPFVTAPPSPLLSCVPTAVLLTRPHNRAYCPHIEFALCRRLHPLTTH